MILLHQSTRLTSPTPPQPLQYLHNTLPLQDEVADAVIADAVFQLIGELQFIFIRTGLEVFETDIGIGSEVFAHFVKVRG